MHVQPRASRSEIVGTYGDALKIRVAAPPVDGAANAELIRFLAERLGLPRGALEIRSGAAAKRKVVSAEGVTVALASERLLQQD